MFSPFSAPGTVVVAVLLLIYLIICGTHFPNYFQLTINSAKNARRLCSVNRITTPPIVRERLSDPVGGVAKAVTRFDFTVIECDRSATLRSFHTITTVAAVLLPFFLEFFAGVIDAKECLITSFVSRKLPVVAREVEAVARPPQRQRRRRVPFLSSTSSQESRRHRVGLLRNAALLLLCWVLKAISVLVETVMVDPLKIFWVLTNSTYLGNVPQRITKRGQWIGSLAWLVFIGCHGETYDNGRYLSSWWSG